MGANTDGSGVLCFPVSGDSMEPMIPDGTTVAVDTNSKRIIDGKLYAIAQEGSGNDKLKRIKQLYRKPGGLLVIHSFNREVNEEAYEADVEIIGRVFWYSVLLWFNLNNIYANSSIYNPKLFKPKLNKSKDLTQH